MFDIFKVWSAYSSEVVSNFPNLNFQLVFPQTEPVHLQSAAVLYVHWALSSNGADMDRCVKMLVHIFMCSIQMELN